MLSAIMDGKLVVWYYPNVVFVDRDLVNQTKFVKESSDFGKDPQILHFHGTNVTIRRSDGAQLVAAVSPYPTALYGIVQRNMWEQAIQLCRYVKDSTLWACLAVMALADKELSTTEVAFAAIDEVAKLQFVSPPARPLMGPSCHSFAWCQKSCLVFSLSSFRARGGCDLISGALLPDGSKTVLSLSRYVLTIKDIPTIEGRNAELALWRRRPDEAEAILLQAGLTYRAIDMHIRLFHWDRALELAVHHKVRFLVQQRPMEVGETAVHPTLWVA
jgi:hypothetical protein